MTHKEIIDKLIGPISPTGDSSLDPEREKNLDGYLHLIELMIAEVKQVHNRNKHSKEASVVKIVNKCESFLEDTLQYYVISIK